MARPLWQLVLGLFLTLPAYLGTGGVASADITASVIRTVGAPVTMTACRSGDYGLVGIYWGFPIHVNLVNRTRYSMISATIAYRAFDVSNEQIGQSTNVISPVELLPSDDTGTYATGAIMGLSEPTNAVAHVTCRVVGATFTGRKTWSTARRWSEKLRPMTSPDTGEPANSRGGNQATSRSRLASMRNSVSLPMQVTNAWDDTLNGTLFVHDTVVVSGGNSDVTLAPSSFVLAINLANGGRKSYPALSTSAPAYSKFNVAANNGAGGDVMVPEVDPSSDLGRLGSITIPAHGSATVTVTFAVTDPVADPKSNRNVTLR